MMATTCGGVVEGPAPQPVCEVMGIVRRQPGAPRDPCSRSALLSGYALLGALSLAGPLSRLPDDRIKQLGPLVAHTAEELTKRLGGRWPHGR